VSTSHWEQWHRPYDDPDSPLSQRLRLVMARVAEAVDHAPPGRVDLVSLCAGQGRDVVGALEHHPRRDDVRGRLVELDPANVAAARVAARAAGLDGLEIVDGDASLTDAYVGAVPAQVVLVCGVFGNIVDADIAHTIQSLPQLCAPGAVVVWTRHRRPPDANPWIRDELRAAGFTELAFDAPEGFVFAVGAAELVPEPLVAGRRLFTFVGDGYRPA
jgi:Putative methyltransferase